MPGTIFYKRATFVTHLPEAYLYTPSHFWLAESAPGLWRVGFTKFATRMLGEIVDHQWEVAEGETIAVGKIIGSIEGFKALSDLYSAAGGTFRGGNPALAGQVELIASDPYGAGWLYMVEGTPDPQCGDVGFYRGLLDATIDRLLAKQHAAEDSP